MTTFDYDFFVIGAGSGGVRAARRAAHHGARVAVAEDKALGGTCVNVGCVPKKLFVYAAEFSHALADARGYGWAPAQPGFNWATLRDNKTNEIIRLNGIYEKLLKDSGADILTGRARLIDPHTVAVGDRRYRARHILIATGGRPFLPDFPGRAHAICSDEAFYLPALPETIVIVGGGYIAVEFAGIFNGLGVKTHLVYRGDLFLRGFDQDVREALATEMGKRGIQLHFNEDIERIDPTADGFRARLRRGGDLDAGLFMYATGRRANTEGLGLEHTKVRLDARGAIEVDADFRTAEPSIYALGDVIGRVELTPVAIREAMVLTENLFGAGGAVMSYDNIPSAVFSQPSIGSVGLTEAQARERYANVRIFKSSFRPMKATLGGGDERALMKLVVNGDDDRVLGCHMLGDHAGEIIQGFAVAVCMGATKADFDRTIGIHPTAAEEFVTLK
ncbi:MAG: glutathione-disulfide reductase [Gammaproteobacteria bacterium]|nr:glutathione-disulfide reductase [Gammaproteobacteria bacterium]